MYTASIPTHLINAEVSVFQDFLSRDYCDIILSAYNDIEKIDNTGPERDNLFDTERTNWRAHHHLGVQNVCHAISEKFVSVFRRGFHAPGLKSLNLNVFESWIGVSGNNAFVEPHDHGSCPLVWAFVFYAKIPNKTSSLRFIHRSKDHVEVGVREGDVLFFPSNLMHYSTDTVPGRTIFSGNFTVSLTMEE